MIGVLTGVFILLANLEDEELGQHEAMDKTALEKESHEARSDVTHMMV